MRPFISSHRCPRCEIRKALCFCEFIPELTLKTRVIVLMHTLEQALTTNTAKLANKALANSEIQIHGLKDERLSKATLHQEGHTSLLLYPSGFAAELNAEFVSNLSQPVTLIVPDANWRQTTKFVRREPAVADIPHVKLPAGPPSEYRLRIQPHAGGMCTLEAIARAIGLLESRDAQSRLEFVLRIMVERTLWSRGMLSADRCFTAGIPVEAFGRKQPGSEVRSGAPIAKSAPATRD